MPEFRRPPEWHQPADRHSVLFDPVLTARKLSRFDYAAARRAGTRIDNALVFVDAQGQYEAYLPPHRPSRSTLASRRFTELFEVDTGVHHVSLPLNLPSDNDAFPFSCSAQASWQVVAPDRFVASGERNVPEFLSRTLTRVLRPVSRLHPVEDSPAAERAVQIELDGAGHLWSELGLHVSCSVRVGLDDAAVAHQRELRALRYADEKLGPQHALRMREDRLAAERALAQGMQHHTYAMQQQELQHQQALLQGRQQVELQRIEKQKIDFYQHYLQQGGVAAWAFHLSEHPEDARLAINSLRKDQLELLQSQKELALQVVRGGQLEDYQLEEPKKLAVQYINAVLTEQLPGAAVAPQPPASDPAALTGGGAPAATPSADAHGAPGTPPPAAGGGPGGASAAAGTPSGAGAPTSPAPAPDTGGMTIEEAFYGKAPNPSLRKDAPPHSAGPSPQFASASAGYPPPPPAPPAPPSWPYAAAPGGPPPPPYAPGPVNPYPPAPPAGPQAPPPTAGSGLPWQPPPYPAPPSAPAGPQPTAPNGTAAAAPGGAPARADVPDAADETEADTGD